MRFRLAMVAIILLCSSFAFNGYANSFKVVFVNPGFPEQNTTGNFWRNVSHFMQAAADDLAIELVTIYACRDHILMKSLVDKVLSHQPDYVILVNEKGVVLTMLKQLALHDVPIFFLLNGLNEKDTQLLSEKEQQLIKGSVIPNNYAAGRELLAQLVALDKSRDSSNQNPHVLALQGDFTTPASLAREQGFKDAVAKHPQLYLIDSTVANWSKQQAYQKVIGLLKRVRIDIIWAANDAMAFGAKQAVLASELDHQVLIGGINWDVDDAQYPIDISYGGHVTLGALALVMLKDLEQGRLAKAQSHLVVDVFESSLMPYYQRFVDRLKAKQIDRYDFSKFSQAQAKPLVFSIKNLDRTFQ